MEAAGEIGDPRLLAVLRELDEWWEVDQDLLDEAIARCGGGPSPDE